MRRYQEKGSILKWVLILLGFLGVLSIGGYLFLQSAHQTQKQYPQSNVGIPKPKISDLAPGVSNTLKTAVTVRHSDSSYEVFLVPNAMVSGYVKNLPEGDAVISQVPASK